MSDSESLTGWPRRYGRYLVFEEFARGGMASVHLGRLVADRGFSRLVAVKMLSESNNKNLSSFYARALEDEARIASRVRHPNVVQPLDVVAERGDILYVMEYVHGVALAQLLETARTGGRDPRVPRDVTVAIMLDVLAALHAAHEAKDETGRPLGVVHRDVSPQNVLVGVDGMARLADFGVAKAMRREERTATGAVKGKPSYMSPEQLRGLPLTRQADVYAAGVVLAVALTGAAPAPVEEHLASEWLREMVERIEDRDFLDIVVTATKPQARDRYATAAEMGAALASACVRATSEAVGACVQDLAGDILERRAELLRRVESADAEATISAPVSVVASTSSPPPSLPPSSTSAPPPPASIPPASVSSPPPRFSSAPAPALAPALARAPAHSPVTPFLLLLLGASLVVGIFFLRNKLDLASASEPSPPSLPADPNTATSVALPSPSPSPSLAPPAPPPRAPSLPAVPTAVAATPHPPRATSRPRTPAPPPAADPPAAAAPAPPARDCDPPFRIDAQGRKHYKPECAP